MSMSLPEPVPSIVRPRRHSFKADLVQGLAGVGLLLCLVGTVQSQPAPQETRPPASRAPTHGPNVYESGGAVHITEPVAGDLLAAGGRISVERAVAHDAALAGGNIAIREGIGEDLRAVGGQVLLDAPVGGDAHIAAGRVAIGRDASIGHSARLAGGEVEVQGRLPGGTRIYAGHAVIAGPVDGDLQVQAGTLELQSGARIDGRLVYASREPIRRDAAAQVRDGIVQRPMLTGRDGPDDDAGPLGGLAFLLGLVAAAMLWVLLFPQWSRGAQERLASTPGKSLAIGAGVLLLAPAAAMLLAITVIGAPLALVGLVAAALLMLAGYLVVAGAVGERLLKITGDGVASARWKQMLALAASVVLLGLLANLPFFGWILTLLALMAGTGALASHIRRTTPPPLSS